MRPRYDPVRDTIGDDANDVHVSAARNHDPALLAFTLNAAFMQSCRDTGTAPRSYGHRSAVARCTGRGRLVQLAVCDLLARPQRSIEFSFDPAGTPAEQVVDSIAEHAAGLIGDRSRLLGVGVAAPGPVDPALRLNLLSINLGWRDVPFADRLEAALGVPTLVEHNVRAMAVAEAHYGAARDVATPDHRAGERGEPAQPGADPARWPARGGHRRDPGGDQEAS